MSNAERLNAALEPVFTGDGEVEIDETSIDAMVEALRPLAAPGFTAMMSGQGTVDRSFEDVEGLRDAWHDWLDVFSRVRLEIVGVEQVGDNVLMAARQVGTTRHGVDVEQPSAAVWKFDPAGLLTRVEFHLDRQAALASAEEPG